LKTLEWEEEDVDLDSGLEDDVPLDGENLDFEDDYMPFKGKDEGGDKYEDTQEDERDATKTITSRTLQKIVTLRMLSKTMKRPKEKTKMRKKKTSIFKKTIETLYMTTRIQRV
jgi:hypothetical protein